MAYFAQIGPDNVVTQVLVAEPDAAAWLASDQGGAWVETIIGHPVERYGGKGLIYTPSDPRKFLYPSEV